MSEAYARGGQPKNIAGGVILILSSLLAALLVYESVLVSVMVRAAVSRWGERVLIRPLRLGASSRRQ